MPSIVCLSDTFDPTDATTLPGALETGMAHFGKTLSEMLGQPDNVDPDEFEFTAREAVFQTLWNCNRDGFGIWFRPRDTDELTRITGVLATGSAGKLIKCFYTDPVDGTEKDLKLFVEEDDEDNDAKKMVVAIPQDRSSVTGNAIYTTEVADQINNLYGDGTDPDAVKDAAFYTLATITFRRCN